MNTHNSRTNYCAGRHFITTMGVIEKGVIITPAELPAEIKVDLFSRACPRQSVIPVKFASGEYGWMARQFLKVLP